MNDKLYVSETIDVCIEGELKDVRATIDNLISVYGESAYLEADNDYTSLVYNRLETDQEYKRRKTEEFKKDSYYVIDTSDLLVAELKKLVNV